MPARGARGLIAAVSPEGAIGFHGVIPWNHPGDMRRFQRVTRGTAVIMGRLTWESMGRRPLPARRNIVVSRKEVPDVESFRTLEEALAANATGPVWFIGGAAIYAEAMAYADVIDLTYVPDRVRHPDAVHFPFVDLAVFEPGPSIPHEDEPALTRRVFHRRSTAQNS